MVWGETLRDGFGWHFPGVRMWRRRKEERSHLPLAPPLWYRATNHLSVCPRSIAEKREHFEKKQSSREIDIRLREERLGWLRGDVTLKVLLLGLPGSGKSTFLKQMGIINSQQSCTEAQRRPYTRLIRRTVFSAIKSLIHGVEILAIPYRHSRSRGTVDVLLAQVFRSDDQSEAIPQEAVGDEAVAQPPAVWSDSRRARPYLPSILDLLEDPAIAEARSRIGEFPLADCSIEYFTNAQNVSRFFRDDYIPTNEDVLHIYDINETGRVEECSFNFRQYAFRMVDVVGLIQKNPQKWMSCFDNVDAVFFFVSITGYDEHMESIVQPLSFGSRSSGEPASKTVAAFARENGPQNLTNRLRQSMALFQKVVENDWSGMPFFLFLNKANGFKKHIQNSHFVGYFSEFGVSGTRFISDIFIAMYAERSARSTYRGRNIHPHTISATDAESIRSVWDAVYHDVIPRMYAGMY